MHEIRPYQKDMIEKINNNSAKKLCVQLATGAGKTFIFSKIAMDFESRVLILVDSKELVQQTANHISGSRTFEAKDKIMPNSKIVICMVQTVNSRLKKNPNLISDFDLIIIDECHVLTYLKTLEYLTVNCKVIGFTATPVTMRKVPYFFCYDHQHMSNQKAECCDSKKIEFTKDFALSDVFDDIIVGIPIKDLISQGFLVQEENYVIPLDDNDFDLDKFGEVSNAEDVFTESYQMDVLGNYKEHCQGKKTMIFTQNTTLNALLYKQFVDAGIENCLMYDSVNESDYSRSEVVDEFRKTPGAILFNVGVFTKGFDVKDVEAIIVSRRISSLSLWIQIVGRGSRAATNIFKDKFIVIDGGTNIERLGRWSDNYDWKSIFEGSDDYKPKKEAPEEQLKECENCGELMPERKCVCDNCEFNNCKVKEIEIKFAMAVPLNIVYPDADKIIRYCENKDKIFALKILNDQIYKMFKNTDKEQFERNLSGGVERVIYKHLRPNYLKIINSSLKSISNRTYQRQKEMLLNKLSKKYSKL